MAKGVGLDAGVFEVKVVELEGSYRKPRLSKVSIDRVASSARTAGEEGRAHLKAEAALHALKDQNISRTDLNLGFPSREAVIRSLTIPFVGDDAIRKVIKFEAEGAIHSHNVDDMIVDFQTYERGDGQSSVLIAAVPKKALGPLLESLEGHGIEPERVDLDAMALFRAAEWAGCFGEDAAEAAAAAAEGDDAARAAVAALASSSSGRRARIVVDVGACATRVLAVVDDRLIDLRALRLGADSIAEALATEFGLSVDEARDIAAVGFETGQDVALESAPIDEEAEQAGLEDQDPDLFVVDDTEGGAEPSEALAISRPHVVPHERIMAARDGFLVRLNRELLRFLTALPRVSEIERLFVTGSGIGLPGVVAELAEIFGCTAQPLDVLAKLSHDLDADEAAQIGPRIATAVGLALGMLGGQGGFNFRKEDLAYRRHFDRIKFPLAIACMLGVFLPFIYGVRQYKQLEEYGKRYGELYQVEEGQGGRSSSGLRAMFWGHVGQLMNKDMPNNVIRNLGPKDFEALTRNLVDAETYQRLSMIRRRLERHLQDQQEQTGVYESLQLPSGVYVLSYFSGVIERVEQQLGSFLVMELDLSLPAQASGRYLSFKVAVRGPGFRQRYAILQDALRDTFTDPASPFSGFGRASTGEDVFEDPTMEGAYFGLKLDVKEEFETRAQ